MAIQLGFDGAVRLTDCDPIGASEVLRLTRDKYAAYVAAIDVGESDRATYWRICFAILSVHSPLEATFAAYRALRLWKARYGRMPSQSKLQTLLLTAKGDDGSVTQYCYQKAGYLREFDAGWLKDKSGYVRGGVSDAEWRIRLQRNVKGLGMAKASFAVAIANPATSDVCCIDTHMYQLFMGKVPTGSVRPKLYLELEEKVRAVGKEVGLSTFATQWALWDARRGVSNPHVALASV